MNASIKKKKCRKVRDMNIVVVTLLLSLIIITIPINCNGKDMLTSPPSQRQITPFKEIISYEVFHHAVKFICALSSSTKNVVTIQLSFPSIDIVKVEICEGESAASEKEGIPFSFSEQDNEFRLKTDSLQVIIKKDIWKLSICRLNGEPVYSEVNRNSGFVSDGVDHKICIAADMQPNEHFYGFGEKFNGLNQRGNKIVMELDDAFASTDEKTYKSIPFFISSAHYGLLVNSGERIVFNMGDTSDTCYSFEKPSGKLEYYIFTNKDPLKIISQYTSITGRCPLIPQWAIEPWLSRRQMTGWNKVNTAEMDIDMMLDDGYRLGVILWEGIRSIFKSDQSSLLYGLSDKWHDLGIKQVFWSQEGHIPINNIPTENVKKEYFILNTDSSYLIGNRYDGAVYVDPTNPEAMDWWKNHYYRHALISKDGSSAKDHWNMDGIKIDFCELFPKNSSDILLKNDIKGMHNLHPVLFSEQIYNWLQEIKPDGGITWVRGGGLGLQRVGYVWGGDRLRNFSQLKGTISASLSVSVCGVSLIGHDLGGYWGGDSPDARETYIRGVQYATFSPAFHDHGSAPAPWEQDEYGRENYRYYSRIRYNILPYLYHYVTISHEEGIPMMRALFLHDPDDPNTFDIDDEYYLGNELLIAPYSCPGNKREIYLPKGKWIDFWTQETYNGLQHITYSAALNRIPVFVKESSVIPLQLNRQMELGGIFQQEEKSDLLLSFRLIKGGNVEFNFKGSEEQIQIIKKVSNHNINVNIKNITEPFGLLVDGVLPESIIVNGNNLETLSNKLFPESIQGWRYDSTQNQTLIKIAATHDISDYSIDIKNILETKKLQQPALLLPPPVIEQVKGWDNSINVSFRLVESAEAYVIKYWDESDTVLNELNVTNSPATLSELINDKKYYLVIHSIRGDSLSTGSPIVSAIPQKRNAFFLTTENQLFIHADHYLIKENNDDGSRANVYGLYSKQNLKYKLWIKARKNINHHMYFRWYQAGSVTLNKGYNYLNLKVLNEMTDIERIYLASSDEERPALKDEAESAFVEKNKFKIKNEIIVEF